MAEPIVRMEPTRVGVEPGGRASVVVTVRNPGTVVEGYDLSVVSAGPMPWATVSPPTLSVYPQQEGTAVVTFAPPAGPGAPGGSFPFGVRAQSQVDAANSAVVEGDLDVGAVAGLRAVLTPVTSSGRWSGRHTVTVSNWGNAPARLRISPQDPDQALGFLVSPPVLDVPLGAEAVARLKVRTRRPTLRGTVQRLPFQVVCEPEEPAALGTPRLPTSTPDRPIVDGAFTQKPILTRMVVTLAGLAALAAIGLVAALLLRPGDATEQDARAAAQPTGLTAEATPGLVTLRWDVVSGVDSYEILQTDPVNDTVATEPGTDPDDDSLWRVKLAVQTAEEYCYQVRALREGAPKSVSSERVCVQTELTPEASASPSPTESPTMVVVPDDGGDTPSPATSPPTPDGTDTAEDPLEWAVAMKFLSTDAQTQAETDLQSLRDAGIPAKLMQSSDWTLDPPLSEPLLVLYVDAASPEEAMASCESASLLLPDVVFTGCDGFLLHVLGPAASAGPLPSPTPTP